MSFPRYITFIVDNELQRMDAVDDHNSPLGSSPFLQAQMVVVSSAQPTDYQSHSQEQERVARRVCFKVAACLIGIHRFRRGHRLRMLSTDMIHLVVEDLCRTHTTHASEWQYVFSGDYKSRPAKKAKFETDVVDMDDFELPSLNDEAWPRLWMSSTMPPRQPLMGLPRTS